MAVGTIQPIALSHLAQECLSLVISRRCRSALYRCLAHNFLPEVSTARSLACKSYLSALGAGLEGHCEREDHQLPNRCYAELNSSLMVQGLSVHRGRHSGNTVWTLSQVSVTTSLGVELEV